MSLSVGCLWAEPDTIAVHNTLCTLRFPAEDAGHAAPGRRGLAAWHHSIFSGQEPALTGESVPHWQQHADSGVALSDALEPPSGGTASNAARSDPAAPPALTDAIVVISDRALGRRRVTYPPDRS